MVTKTQPTNKELPFLRGIIHQVNNWMGAIIGQGDYALSLQKPEDIKSGLSMAVQLSEMTSKLLSSLSRYINEKPGNVRSGDLAEIADEILLLTENWLVENGFEVSKQLSPAPVSNLDTAAVRQTALRTLQSLAESAADGGSIRLETAIDENGPFLSITASGMGREMAGDIIDLPPAQSQYALRCTSEYTESGDLIFKVRCPQ